MRVPLSGLASVSGVQIVANIESKKRRNWGETVSSRFYLVVAIATKRCGDQAGAFL